MKLKLFAFLFLVIAVTGLNFGKRKRPPGLRGSGLLLSGNRQAFLKTRTPSSLPKRTRRIGVRPQISINETDKFPKSNREGKSFLNPLVREIGGLKFAGKNQACEGNTGKGRCLYLWECPTSVATRENIAPCTNHFFHQCCILRDDDPASETTEIPTTVSEKVQSATETKAENVTEHTNDTTTQVGAAEKLRPRPLMGFTSTPNVVQTAKTAMFSGLFEKSNLNPIVYDCGFRPLIVESRILGGKKSGFGSWPWIVSVRKMGSGRDKEGDMHRSGGSLISDEWVLTAAHTVARTARIVVPEAKLLVRLGDYNLKDEDELLPYMNRKVSHVIVHPEFNGITYENDIALLKLDRKVKFRDNIQPVCLPEPEFLDAVEERSRQKEWGEGVIAGWGRVAQGGDQSDVLLDVKLPIVTHTECEEMFAKQNYSEEISRQFICAGGDELGGKDSCQGDSGGPMVVSLGANRWQLVGLVSWGIGCGVPGLPGVLTSVSHYTEWIITNINNFSS
ncbi:Serine proteinase stubble [Nymphon striatum]|nr:Serine proteinase stubble [Nymphon striatum]